MSTIPKKVSDAFEELKEKYDIYLELKKINGHFYIYHATSEWDAETKKVRKITEYLGKITIDGQFREKGQRKRQKQSYREIFEYGNVALAHSLIEDVEKILLEITPYAQDIIAMAILKAIDPKPLRLLPSQWSKMYLSREMEVNLSPNSTSALLQHIGTNVSDWYDLFSKFIQNDEIVLYDLTAIFTYSENIKLAEKGYNAHYKFLDQLGVIMAFSKSETLPVGVEVFHGSIRDIKTIRDFVNRLPARDFGFIFDRGFSSYKLLDDLRDEHISYIVPLKKASKYLKIENIPWDKLFLYRKRPIRSAKLDNPHGTLFCFEDPRLKGEQESALLRKVIEGTLSLEKYEIMKKRAGLIGIISNLNEKSTLEIFELYKGREEVELVFDSMKNELDADKTYLQTNEGVRGFFFVIFLALRIYFGVLKRLRERNVNQKISVDEVFYELSKIQKIVEKGGRNYFAKAPKRAEDMQALFADLIPMG